MDTNHIVFCRLAEFVLCLSVNCVLMGCATPYSTPSIEPDTVSFNGVRDALSNSSEAPDILLVHGMCTHTVNDLQGANAALAKALNMEPQTPEKVNLQLA